MVTQFLPGSPARLFRSTVLGPAEISKRSLEQVGDGSFHKMVRIALSDPDDEVWRYVIDVSGDNLEGDAIRRFAAPLTKRA